MNVLIIGGTGLISVGIVKHLLDRGANVTMFNRGQRESALRSDVAVVHGDRNDSTALGKTLDGRSYDVVIDMICFNVEQADQTCRTFAGRVKQMIFCSTVCTYGVKVPPGVLVDETLPQEPVSDYGRNKVAAEKRFMVSHARGDFAVTIIRPSSTYGEGGRLIDNVEFNAVAWDRIRRGLPVLCSGDGLGLWNSTHRDDCGKAFAYACLNDKTFGQDYNATIDRVITWRTYYAEAAEALGGKARLLFMPASWIYNHDPARFGLSKEITQFHGAYTSAKARRDIPEFVCEVDFKTGSKRMLDDMKSRGVLRDSVGDDLYDKMIAAAERVGIEAVEV